VSQQEQEGFTVSRMPAVKERVKLCESVIWQEIKEGRFPPPIKLSARAVAWIDSEIDQYLLQKKVERDAKLASQEAKQQRAAKRRVRAA
jgi:prophage regulatory protein